MKSLADAAELLSLQISSNIIKPAFSLDSITALLFLLPMSLIISAAEVLTCTQKRDLQRKAHVARGFIWIQVFLQNRQMDKKTQTEQKIKQHKVTVFRRRRENLTDDFERQSAAPFSEMR